ncbi:MAG: alpha-L-arabinofuranosidase, partial [Mucilaginibacter polytrichastri]|nr:alpha-L-arabinofuranosidase [Mucilaginibacter polytrichastri]
MHIRTILAAILLPAAIFTGEKGLAQAPLQLSVNAAKPGPAIAPTMWGIFFEDINFAADGGLYAELVKNRSFEFAVPMMGWDIPDKTPTGRILIVNDAKNNAANPRYGRITRDSAGGEFVLQNEGFRGIGVEKGKSYTFSAIGRTNGPAGLKLKISLLDEKGTEIGSATVPDFTGAWNKQTVTLSANGTAQKGKLQLSFTGEGSVDIDMISLFPKNTWMGRPNGLRRDLVQKLADLKPGFIRFPGGCIVEGRDLANRYQWKKTVGATENRQLIINRWNTEFSHKNAPDYFQSFGLGFYEYFQLAEDLGAAPLPILNCGMACQFNTGEVVSMEELDPFIQDALDLIEFANAPVSTKWGKLRADMGHPKPFNLTMMGVGNEQWDRQYIERYKIFEKVLKEKHPEIKLVSGSGPFSGGEWFDYAWKELKTSKVDFIDEHYYAPPNWFLTHANRYDTYDRKGPKVFAGEYAAHTKEDSVSESRNNWQSALAEAAFMTGL